MKEATILLAGFTIVLTSCPCPVRFWKLASQFDGKI